MFSGLMFLGIDVSKSTLDVVLIGFATLPRRSPHKVFGSGIAPVIEASGKIRLVQRRFARPLFLHQSFME